MSDFPRPCELCAPYDGNWVMSEGGGLKRCNCARGQALAQARELPMGLPPVLSGKEATLLAAMMASIPFFPAESEARGVIASEICSMCRSTDEAKWLVMRMSRLYEVWPGTAEMRRVYWTKFRPLDGLEPIGGSSVYPRGIPSERPVSQEPDYRQLPAAARKLLAEALGGAAKDVVIPVRGRSVIQNAVDSVDAAAVIEQQRRNVARQRELVSKVQGGNEA